MASEPSSNLAKGAEDVSSDALLVNLQVVSPSPGVNRPLLFPSLPALTTIKQLKQRIKETLPLQPLEENQRLIYRGRALLRENDSLLDILGVDTIRNSVDNQTLHLVLRDVSDTQTPPPVTMNPPAIQPSLLQNAQRPPTTLPIYGPPPPAGFPRRTPFQTVTTTTAIPQPGGPSPVRAHSPSPIHTPEQAAAFQQQHQHMTSWLTQLQREAMARAIVNQNQRGRAHVGMRGIGDNGPQTPSQAPDGQQAGTASPASHFAPQTYHREISGPNSQGQYVETITRTLGPNPFSPQDSTNALRSSDSHAVPVGMANVIHRSASNPSLQSRQSGQSIPPSSVFAAPTSRASSGRATPDLALRQAAAVAGLSFTHPSNLHVPTRPGVDVYILSSPDGPRALVFNNTTSETYYTPRISRQTSFPQLRNMASYPNLIHSIPPRSREVSRHRSPLAEQRHPIQDQQILTQFQQQQQQQQQQARRRIVPQPQQGQQQQPRQPAAPRAPNIIPMHPNPHGANARPLLMQIVPHLWLILRLALFVWFFTSPEASWSRWLTIIALAVLMFAFSTGIFNGFADHAWRPLGRHLENVFPVAELAGGRNRQSERGSATDQIINPEPAEMAARLVAGRRQESWIAGQARRIERAGLLFIASILPGVAERHIANLEAEVRAEEARRREAEAAAAAAAAAAAEAETAANPDTTTNEPRNDADVVSGDAREETIAGQQQSEQQDEPVVQLNTPLAEPREGLAA